MSLANVIAPPERYSDVALSAGSGCTITENNSQIQGNLVIIEFVVSVNTNLSGTPVLATLDDYVVDKGKLLSVVGVSDTYAYTQTGANTIRLRQGVSQGTTVIVWGVITVA